MKIDILSPQAIYEVGKRSGQEDAIFPKMGEASELDSLFIVCDGMGGHERGEVASGTVTQAMADFIFQNTSPEEPFTDTLFEQALEAAYLKLDEIDDGAAKKPGTTLTFLYFHRNGCTVAHIGDSRIYHVRPQEGRVLYRSRDHSVVYDLYLAGEIEFDEMNRQPNKNIITKAMMPGKEQRQKANIVHIADVKPGDYFYLCSDGMLEEMTDGQIVEILSSNATDEQKKNRFIAETKENKDNHSAYLIHVDKVTAERRDVNLPDNEAQMMAKSVRRVDGDDDAVVVQLQPEETQTITKGQAQTSRTRSAQSSKAAQSYQPAQTSKSEARENRTRRSLLIPIITTAALLLILVGVYFTCSGKDEKAVKKDEVATDTVAEPVKKPERDTMNIAGGEVGKTALPTPTDGLQQPEQKQPEEKKKEEPKPEEGNNPAAGNNEGNAPSGNTDSTTPANGSTGANPSTEPVANPTTPVQQAPPANTDVAPANTPTPQPAQPTTPAQPEPKSIIPGE